MKKKLKQSLFMEFAKILKKHGHFIPELLKGDPEKRGTLKMIQLKSTDNTRGCHSHI